MEFKAYFNCIFFLLTHLHSLLMKNSFPYTLVSSFLHYSATERGMMDHLDIIYSRQQADTLYLCYWHGYLRGASLYFKKDIYKFRC